ncbi:hypothetical protein [Paraburkholderia sp. BCC1885]|uniref:hypothetical protein n=1 Tax=Paraburkholderia sp. BCC1885 TaxID=2562669 RepID=UPI0021B26176|nr:hypothetical protein [Paraburkholderia sp. BCC1885]
MNSNAGNTATGAVQQYQTVANSAVGPDHTQRARSPRNGPLTTDAMAAAVGVLAQSVRKRYSETGTYFGLKPIKLPNRRLMWDAQAVEKFLRGEAI